MDVYGIAQITEIGEGAFENHSKIETIHIPSCVTVIRKNAFLGCANLKKITFGGISLHLPFLWLRRPKFYVGNPVKERGSIFS